MMNKKSFYLKIGLIFSIIGVLFSGYYSLVKLSTDVCPFNESCPYVFGCPACYFGFIIFCICLLSSILSLVNNKLAIALIVDSLIGVMFSGYLTYLDVFHPTCPGGQCEYDLILPTCAYGFIFFLVILIASIFGQITPANQTTKK